MHFVKLSATECAYFLNGLQSGSKALPSRLTEWPGRRTPGPKQANSSGLDWAQFGLPSCGERSRLPWASGHQEAAPQASSGQSSCNVRVIRENDWGASHPRAESRPECQTECFGHFGYRIPLRTVGLFPSVWGSTVNIRQPWCPDDIQ